MILARPFTEADDIAGFHAAVGILTSEGGKASHAALVARGMGVPAVTGAGVAGDRPRRGRDPARRRGRPARRGPGGDRRLRRGGDRRRRAAGRAADERGTSAPCSSWSDERAALGVRTNADTPEDARKAREFGAEGIGLCRTEHMFFGAERNEAIVAVILADTDEDRQAGLRKLLPLQQGDFEEIFAAMDGLPVTIRLLDPPLHEFLPRCPTSKSAWREAEAARAADVADARTRPGPGAGAAGGQPDARHPRRAASGSSSRRSTRCRSRRSSRALGATRDRGLEVERRDHGAAGRLPPRARDPARADRRDRRAGRASSAAATTRSGR